MSEADTPQMRTGVENPDIIDLITPDPGTGEVVLVIYERRPWGSDPRQLEQFDEKLNRYLIYVLDNFLSKQYPEYTGRPVRIQIDCVDRPTGEREQLFLEGVAMVCEQNGLNFWVRVTEEEQGEGA